MKIFETQHGVAFGFVRNTSEGRIEKRLHSYSHYGLLPVSIKIDAPEVNTSGIYVPGMDGKIDTTDSLDGVVHYKNRKAEFKFKMLDAQGRWQSTYHELLGDLHGQKRNIILDDDDNGYYVGRFSVDKPQTKKIGTTEVAYFTVKGDCKPYQYDFFNTGHPWLWAPFRFTRDCIRRDYTAVTVYGGGQLDKVILSSDMPVTPTIRIVDRSTTDITGIDVDYENIYEVDKTKTINYGDSGTLSDLILSSLRQKQVTLTLSLNGTGLTSHDYATVNIDYETGRL